MHTVEMPSREKLVDEFGQLSGALPILETHPTVVRYIQTLKRYDDLARTIRDWYVEHPADQPALAEGVHYQVQIAARGEERVFRAKAKAAIFKELKSARAWQIFDLTLKAVLSNPAIAHLISLATLENVGSRKLTLIAKIQAEDAKAA